MDNQHRIIKGYRDLSAEEIALINKVKAHGEATQALIDEVDKHLHTQFGATHPEWRQQNVEADTSYEAQRAETPEVQAAKAVENERLTQAEPFRWLAMARSDLQVGIMKLNRAVAQPGSF